MMDPPDHTAMRRLVGKQMTRAGEPDRGRWEAFVDARLDRMADAGGSPIDIVGVLFGRCRRSSCALPRCSSRDAGELRRVDERDRRANAEGSFESAMGATLALLASPAS